MINLSSWILNTGGILQIFRIHQQNTMYEPQKDTVPDYATLLCVTGKMMSLLHSYANTNESYRVYIVVYCEWPLLGVDTDQSTF